MSTRIGFDVGGTFTDFVVLEDGAGEFRYFKLPSTPADPAIAISDGLDALVSTFDIDPRDCGMIGHGTTVATNLVIERKVARTALLTTTGFRDVLEIGRQTRPNLYDYRIRRPQALVPREFRLEVGGRLLADGSELEPLDETAVRQAARRFAADGIEAVAVCFIHAYKNPAHEIRAGEILREELPEVYVSLSSEVLPEFREYERLSTTVLNAAVGPRMNRYLDNFLTEVERKGIPAIPQTVHSNGGLMSPDAVREVPVRTCLSGPAAGVNGAARIGQAAGLPDIITFDVGGTSTDVSLIRGGEPLYTSTCEVAQYPLKTPMIDIQVIGAGGGSIARVDDAGALVVGPESAGAMPGPVAYDRGGDKPTLTDANIVLGRLDPVALLQGRLPVNAAAARDAIERQVARPLGLSVEEAAHGILRIAVSNMARTIRSVSTERGYDARNFALAAFGGAGPLHACDLAAETGMNRILVPMEPGTLCARGILLSDVTMDFVRTRVSPFDLDGWDEIRADFDGLDREATVWLDREGIGAEDRSFIRTIEGRYEGQNFEISIDADALLARGPAGLPELFRERHVETYGYDVAGRGIEIVNLRLRAVGSVPKPMPELAPRKGSVADAELSRRHVWWGGAGWVDTPILDRAKLPLEQAIPGPCIIEEMSSTTLVPVDGTARLDRFGNIIITLEG